jgi:anti-anti-sigma regulatory factor
VSEVLAASSGDLVLDLDYIYFIDEAGLLALRRLKQAVEGSGRRLVLRRVNSAALRLLQTTEMAGNFEVR